MGIFCNSFTEFTPISFCKISEKKSQSVNHKIHSEVVKDNSQRGCIKVGVHEKTL